jgi:hypothetical protein
MCVPRRVGNKSRDPYVRKRTQQLICNPLRCNPNDCSIAESFPWMGTNGGPNCQAAVTAVRMGRIGRCCGCNAR